MKVNWAIKNAFFDSRPVLDAVDKATRKVFSRFGAFVRTRAKSSIRPRKAPSAPGSPPSSHTGILKRFIYFAYSSDTQSVIIGPAATNQVGFDTKLSGGVGTIPEILERGGSAGVVEEAYRLPSQPNKVYWVRRDLRYMGKVALLSNLRERAASGRRLAGRNGATIIPCGQNRFRTYKVAARPFMGPAFEREKQGLPAMWADSVK